MLAISLAGLAACGGGSSTNTNISTIGGTPDTGGNPSGYTLSASIAANTAAPITGQEVRLSPSVSIVGTTSVTATQVIWDFGDGSPAVSISNAASFTTPQFKSYANTGTYIVTLSATDSTGRSGSVTRSISVSSFAPTGLLNDTGIDWCSENITTPSVWVNNAVCSAVNWAGNLWGTMQDAYFGRDAEARAGTLVKVGSGMAGFDFTRLGADGQPLAIQNATYNAAGNEQDGTRWDCIRDNHTGLIWEVKRMDDPTHLRHYTATFGWYSTDNTNNGGNAGSENNAISLLDDGEQVTQACNGLPDLNKCNTQAYNLAVNTLLTGQALCGFRDWRLPSSEELLNLVHYGASDEGIDTNHFPEPFGNSFSPAYMWSSSPVSGIQEHAWFVSFYGQGRTNGAKTLPLGLRLVRSGK